MMERWGIPALGLLLLALLCSYCIDQEARSIEQDLAARTLSTLQSANIPASGAIQIDGQEVTLSGPQGSPLVSPETRRRIASIWGVTAVHVRETAGNPVSNRPAAEAPKPPPVVLSPQATQLEENISRVIRNRGIRFASASDVLLPESRRLLDEVARLMNLSPEVSVEIAAHTDSDGDAGRNLELSKRRALAVKNYLISRKVAASRLVDVGYGSTKPLTNDTTAAGKARNRRIEFRAKS